MPMYSRTVTMCKAKHLRNYISQEVGYNVDFTFDYNKDEVHATFTCSDDFADPRLRHNNEDLEEYIIKRYGAFLIREDQPKPNNFAMDMKKIVEVLTNPKLEHRDDYQEERIDILSKPKWLQLKQDCKGVKFDKRIHTKGYKPDSYQIRMGLWHG